MRFFAILSYSTLSDEGRGISLFKDCTTNSEVFHNLIEQSKNEIGGRGMFFIRMKKPYLFLIFLIFAFSFFITLGCQTRVAFVSQKSVAITFIMDDQESKADHVSNQNLSEQFEISRIELAVFNSSGEKFFEDKVNLDEKSIHEVHEVKFQMKLTLRETYKFVVDGYNSQGKKVIYGEALQKITEDTYTIPVRLELVPSNIRIKLSTTDEFRESYETSYSRVKLFQNQNLEKEIVLKSDEEIIVEKLKPGVWKAVLEMLVKEKGSNNEIKLNSEKYFFLGPSSNESIRFLATVDMITKVLQEYNTDSNIIVVDISPDSSFLIAVSNDKNNYGKITKWKRVTDSSGKINYEIEAEKKIEHSLYSGKISSNGQWVIVNGSAWFYVYDSNSLEEIKRVNISASTFEISSDCKYVVISDYDSTLSLYTFPEFERIWRYKFSDGRIYDIKLSSDNKLLLALRGDSIYDSTRKITFHDLENGNVLKEIFLETGLHKLILSNNKKWLAGPIFFSNYTFLIDLESRDIAKKLPYFSSCPIFSNDNKFLILPDKNYLTFLRLIDLSIKEVPVNLSFRPQCSKINCHDNLIVFGSNSNPNFTIVSIEKQISVK